MQGLHSGLPVKRFCIFRYEVFKKVGTRGGLVDYMLGLSMVMVISGTNVYSPLRLFHL